MNKIKKEQLTKAQEKRFDDIWGSYDSSKSTKGLDYELKHYLASELSRERKRTKKQIKEQLDKEYDGLYNTWEHRSVNWCYRVFKHILK